MTKTSPRRAFETDHNDGKILNVKISGTSKDKVLTFLSTSLKNKFKFFITTPNPEIIVEANRNAALLKTLNSSDLALADGTGLVLASKLFGLKNIRRLPGRTMFLDLLTFADQNHLKIFLLGSTPVAIEKSLARLSASYPRLKAEAFSGPYLDKAASPVSKADLRLENESLTLINRFKPDLLFVAFGAPKQELWISRHFNKLNIGGAMVIGGTLDYFSGEKPLPPGWLSRLGLEWLWRLLHEPGHLKRVYTAIVIFPVLLIKSLFQKSETF